MNIDTKGMPTIIAGQSQRSSRTTGHSQARGNSGIDVSNAAGESEEPTSLDQASRSQPVIAPITNWDAAQQAIEFVKNSIFGGSGSAILAQANLSSNSVFSLVQ